MLWTIPTVFYPMLVIMALVTGAPLMRRLNLLTYVPSSITNGLPHVWSASLLAATGFAIFVILMLQSALPGGWRDMGLWTVGTLLLFSARVVDAALGPWEKEHSP